MNLKELVEEHRVLATSFVGDDAELKLAHKQALEKKTSEFQMFAKGLEALIKAQADMIRERVGSHLTQEEKDKALAIISGHINSYLKWGHEVVK